MCGNCLSVCSLGYGAFLNYISSIGINFFFENPDEGKGAVFFIVANTVTDHKGVGDLASDVVGGEVHLTGDEGHDVADHHAQQDGDDLQHALTPDVGNDHHNDGHQCQPPAGHNVRNGRAGKVEADHDDHGAGDDGGEEAHDLLGTQHLEKEGQHQIQKTCDHHAAQCVGQLRLRIHALIGGQGRHGGEAAQVGEGGAQEHGALEAGEELVDQSADTGAQQSGGGAHGGSALGHGAAGVDDDGNHQSGGHDGEHLLQCEDDQLGKFGFVLNAVN